MKKNTTRTIAAAGAGLLALSLAAPSFAQGSKPAEGKSHAGASREAGAKRGGPLGALVKEQVLTAEQAKSVKDALAAYKSQAHSAKADALGAAITAAREAGSITGEQADALRAAISGGELGAAAKKAGINPAVVRSIVEQVKVSMSGTTPVATVLATLVDAGTLTAEQAQKVGAALESAKTPGTASGREQAKGSGRSPQARPQMPAAGVDESGSSEPTHAEGSEGAGRRPESGRDETPRTETPRTEGRRPEAPRPSEPAHADEHEVDDDSAPVPAPAN